MNMNLTHFGGLTDVSRFLEAYLMEKGQTDLTQHFNHGFNVTFDILLYRLIDSGFWYSIINTSSLVMYRLPEGSLHLEVLNRHGLKECSRQTAFKHDWEALLQEQLMLLTWIQVLYTYSLLVLISFDAYSIWGSQLQQSEAPEVDCFTPEVKPLHNSISCFEIISSIMESNKDSYFCVMADSGGPKKGYYPQMLPSQRREIHPSIFNSWFLMYV